MDKSKAIELLGGTTASVAAAVGVTTQAVSQWPDVLPRRIADRVQAALWRENNPLSADAASDSGTAELQESEAP